MNTTENFIEQLMVEFNKKNNICFSVKIIPKSPSNKLIGLIGTDILKIRIAAVPEQNRANKELCRFLAKIFGVTKESVTIISGQTSPRKLININKNS